MNIKCKSIINYIFTNKINQFTLLTVVCHVKFVRIITTFPSYVLAITMLIFTVVVNSSIQNHMRNIKTHYRTIIEIH